MPRTEQRPGRIGPTGGLERGTPGSASPVARSASLRAPRGLRPTLPGPVQLGCHHPGPDHSLLFWESRQPPLPLLSFPPFFQSARLSLLCAQQRAEESFKNINWIKGSSSLMLPEGLVLHLESLLSLFFRRTRPSALTAVLPLARPFSHAGPSLPEAHRPPPSLSTVAFVDPSSWDCVLCLTLTPPRSRLNEKGLGPPACGPRLPVS
ncbi:hypothetical protein HJG60_012054 [Phyllostomus discolor]|uniref:Uncharacterized protein n=1 Tax=Phyllostomus discolor TaxID=89673 RepID=A0A834DWB7_9CHIR|nr:hypothetical protein HJG60_012054 [Phyllostomus discolor]